MAVEKVISGGQTGVDIAALRAARSAGIPTGGWCPRGWLTELGPQPELLQEFGLHQHESAKYPARTHANVEAGDCTLIIADALDSGSELTALLCRQLKKPMLHLRRREITTMDKERVATVVAWLRDGNYAIVNVAGNRESKAPGIEKDAEDFLCRVFTEMA